MLGAKRKKHDKSPVPERAYGLGLTLVAYVGVLLTYILPLILFLVYGELVTSRELVTTFQWHFLLLMLFSFTVSILLIFAGTCKPLLLVFRGALFFLLTYPFGLGEEITLILLLGVLTEIALYLSFRAGAFFMLFTLLVAATLGTTGSVFNLVRDATPLYRAIFALTVSALYGTALLLVRWSLSSGKIAMKKIGYLNSVISQLSHANLDFQRYVHSVEYSAVNTERRRISREIHDTVGYSLTNILITLEAATDLLKKDQERASAALSRSIREAQICLDETRNSMRRMRSHDLQEAVGLQAIAHLARSFSEATGMMIRVEYGNAPDTFGAEIDLVLFRIIQEGITNAFRHGMATEVRISLWIEAGILHVIVSDNGQGAKEVVDGLGLSGMRERVESVGGEVQFLAGGDGFRVRSMLPLKKKLKEQIDE